MPLLADDELGAGRESGVDDAYLGAFDDIAADPRSRPIVADVDGQVAGTRADAIGSMSPSASKPPARA